MMISSEPNATFYVHIMQGIVRYPNGIERDITPEEIDRYSKSGIDLDGDFITDLNLLKEMLENET